MNYQRAQTPTTEPLQTTAAPQSAPTISPLLGLQGLIGNAGLLDLLRPQMPGAQPGVGSSSIADAATRPAPSVLQQDATLADEGQTAALTSAVAAELGTTPSDVPVLGTAVATMAPVTKFAWETLGGFAKGAGDLVGGLGHMVAHALDTLSGLATMAEHIPGSPLKVLHKLYDVATTDTTLEETFWRNPLDVAGEDLSADWDFWKKVGGAVIEPYERSVEQGRYGEALGRRIFDIGGLFVGASEFKALGKGAQTASTLNKVDEAVKVAGRLSEIGPVTEELARAGGTTDDVMKAASHIDDVADLGKADDATKLSSTIAGGAPLGARIRACETASRFKLSWSPRRASSSPPTLRGWLTAPPRRSSPIPEIRRLRPECLTILGRIESG